MSYRVFLTARIAGPRDTAGYEVTHVVDSIVADSGSFMPPTLNLVAARGLRFAGRLTPSGEVRDITPSDTAQARLFGQLLGSVRDFYPRLPAQGLRADASWIDTLTTTERSAGSEVVLRAVRQWTARGWEECYGRRCLRLESEGSHTVLGSGEQGGQPFEMTGSGTRRGLDFVSADGRYLGGEARDSASILVTLPAQGMTVPIRQMVHSTVTVLP
jgi:hypothetical protein